MPADEFEIIRTLLAPLATDPGARGLRDDVAVLGPLGTCVVTTDAIVEGVHFLPDDPIETIAQKALRVNLSDLGAKGATARYALLTLIWPESRKSEEIACFVGALGADLEVFSLALVGGDIVATPGPLAVSMTLLGAPLGPRTPSRADARPGDDLWLTGPIGDAFLGLRALRAGAGERAGAAVERYRTPIPRVDVAALVAEHAQASMDVSDGLIADAGKLAAASGVGVEIDTRRTPLSAYARQELAAGAVTLTDLLTGGDDYEILLTAGAERRPVLESAGLHRIGRVIAGQGLIVIGESGPLDLRASGYTHRLGS